MLSDARLSVVTVVAADAFGSGFLISTDGYLLTNQHVVGKARYVIARFVTGREVHGEVIRTNADRDIALVKLEGDRYRPLPLGNTSALKPGTDVFAIGTPLFEEFGQTISKGIVSGYGESEGQRLIRSDVGIHKGSSGGPLLVKSGQVVGVAVEGVILPQIGVGVGLNSFIPIEEAIETLRLRNPDATAKPRLEVASRVVAEELMRPTREAVGAGVLTAAIRIKAPAERHVGDGDAIHRAFTFDLFEDDVTHWVVLLVHLFYSRRRRMGCQPPVRQCRVLRRPYRVCISMPR